MDNKLQLFNSNVFGNLTVIQLDNEPWFIGKEIADKLQYTELKGLYKLLNAEDKKLVNTRFFKDTCKGFEIPLKISPKTRSIMLINESGLYTAMYSSRLPIAVQFRKWITSEVLPTIRKHGAYLTDILIEQTLTNPDYLIQIATKLKEERQLRYEAERLVQINKPKIVFSDAVASSKSSILIGDLAKLLKQNNVDIGQRRLFEYLREKGYLMKQGTSRNLPTQRAMEMGLFQIKETTQNSPNDGVKIFRTTKVTGKGQIYFINHFLKQNEEVVYKC